MWVLEGLKNKDIGEKLFIDERTVKFHLGNIYKILKLKSRYQLMAWAHREL